MNVAIVGHAGLIGDMVAARARTLGHIICPPPRLRVKNAYRAGTAVWDAARDWLGANPSECETARKQLEGVDVVINAAGSAEPESGDEPLLYDANAVLPGVVAELAAEAGVRRFIHVSTAAVQGRRQPLDETAEVEPFSPYTSSKAAGEQVLLEGQVRAPAEVVVYRPTSVQAPGRAITRKFVVLASKPWLPLPRQRDVPLPVCLAENVAAGIVHCVGMKSCPALVLQPWEGITTRLLLEAMGHHPRFTPVPTSVVRGLVWTGLTAGRRSAQLGAMARRLDLLAFGQRQQATVLEQVGFRPQAGVEAYKVMAERIRAIG